MHRRLQKALKDLKVGGTDLSEQKVTTLSKNFKVGVSD